MEKIKTKIHPLQKSILQPGSSAELLNRPNNEINLLTYNVQCIPKLCDLFNDHPCKYGDERVKDMFLTTNGLADFDIICVQELFRGLPGSQRDQFIMYA
jgi:hypothetical protein